MADQHMPSHVAIYQAMLLNLAEHHLSRFVEHAFHQTISRERDLPIHSPMRILGPDGPLMVQRAVLPYSRELDFPQLACQLKQHD